MTDDGKKQPERPEITQERIRDLAYFMWEAGGRQHGRALEYWLQAERVLLTYQHEGTSAETRNGPAPTGTKAKAQAGSPGKPPAKKDNGGA